MQQVLVMPVGAAKRRRLELDQLCQPSDLWVQPHNGVNTGPGAEHRHEETYLAHFAAVETVQ